MDVGIFGTTWFFDVLRAHELDSVALGVLNETTYPSFGYMISQGATTLWEAWDGTAHTIGGGGTSRNHIMFGTSTLVVELALLPPVSHTPMSTMVPPW